MIYLDWQIRNIFRIIIIKIRDIVDFTSLYQNT